MNHNVNIRIIDKKTRRESKALTFKFLKAINNDYLITLPENCIISIS